MSCVMCHVSQITCHLSHKPPLGTLESLALPKNMVLRVKLLDRLSGNISVGGKYIVGGWGIPNNVVSFRFYNERHILTPSDYVFQAEVYRS